MEGSMIVRYVFGLMSLLLVALLSGCGGLHVVPDNNYSVTDDPNTIRVAFDQDGDIYPQSPPDQMPNPPKFNINWAFTLADSYERRTGQPYTRQIRDQIYDEVTKQVIAATQRLGTNRVVFLVHGYNNSYREASGHIDDLKIMVRESMGEEEAVFVEVYWDGLYKGRYTWPPGMMYWFDGMTYSNIVGQRGVRRLLNQLPAGLDVVFITHSRGAGVAFSAFADPDYDDDIEVPCYERLRKDHFASVTIIPIAPAIGDGHPLEALKAALPADSRVVVGFNENDWVLGKEFLFLRKNPENFGSTQLGTDDEYFREQESLLNADGRVWLQRVVYQCFPKHRWDEYIEHEATACLLWRGGLVSDEPSEYCLKDHLKDVVECDRE